MTRRTSDILDGLGDGVSIGVPLHAVRATMEAQALLVKALEAYLMAGHKEARRAASVLAKSALEKVGVDWRRLYPKAKAVRP